MIAICSDHRGYKMKEEIKKYLEEEGIEYINFGTDSEERVDAIVFATKVCKAIQNGEADKGILICGTGIAMSMIANKFKRIMCALCYSELAAERSREHNDANVLALGAEMVSDEKAVEIVKIWLNTEHLGGRYAERVEMIRELENKNMK